MKEVCTSIPGCRFSKRSTAAWVLAARSGLPHQVYRRTTSPPTLPAPSGPKQPVSSAQSASAVAAARGFQDFAARGFQDFLVLIRGMSGSPLSLESASTPCMTLGKVRMSRQDPCTTSLRPRRAAVVGLGARARMFTEALTGPFAERVDLVGFCDPNTHRMAVHNSWIAADHPDRPPVPAYGAEEFEEMLRRERVDLVVVCTVDRSHDHYIVRALEAGCDVVTEKPMTTDAERARRILDARRRTGREVRVSFNYRYNPVHSAVRELIASGEIGEVGSVHFEWLLDLRHGADYFRRWHRDKADSGGLLVHKSTHHFDLVNWWLGTRPDTVFAQGGLFFYGDEAGRRRGLARDYTRAHGSPAAESDPFALHLKDSPSSPRSTWTPNGRTATTGTRTSSAPA